MTQLSAMPTVTKLALHRETVMHLAGGRPGEGNRAFRTCTNYCSAQCPSLICTYTCAKHCTKKPGGCLA
jgi:hypothetical protein